MNASYRLHLAIAFAQLAILVTCEQASGQSSTEVMTYNIRYLNNSDGEDVWANRQSAVIETIRGAEIVGLQEVVLAQLDAIRSGTPEMTWYGVGRDDGREQGEFAPIGYRQECFTSVDQGTWWLSETPDVAGSKGWDAALPRTVTWVLLQSKSDETQLLVLNTHFDHRGELARQNSGKLIAERVDAMAKDVAVIVMGDFNAQPDSKAITNVKAGAVALDDSRQASQKPPSGPEGTWNGFQKIDAGSRIDYLFVNDRVQVLAHEVLDPKTNTGRFASDHLPVRVTISHGTQND